MLSSCWAPCFTLNSGYLRLETASKVIAVYTATVHVVFFFYGTWLLFGGQSDTFFSPFFEFNRKDNQVLASIFIVYCLFYIFFCSVGLFHAIKTETRFYYFPWLYTSICEILFMVAFGIFIFYRYYHNGWSLFAAIIYWSTAAYHFYLYCVVLSLYYYIKRLQEPNFVIVWIVICETDDGEDEIPEGGNLNKKEKHAVASSDYGKATKSQKTVTDQMTTRNKDLGPWSTTEDVLGSVDLTGKVAIVTGANCGIGLETAKALSSHGAHVILACRSLDRANEAMKQIQAQYKNAKLSLLQCDLTSLCSVKTFCDQFLSLNLNLDILILNAAVTALPYTLTGDGFEKTFQVNHLSHFYLVRLLEPKLIESAPSRVVFVSSESHRFSTLNCANVDQEWRESNFISFMAYNDSKLCNVLTANELHRRVREQGVTVVSCHPGNMVSTSLQRYWWFLRLLYLLAWPFTKSVNQAASTVVFCATAPEIERQGGKYFNNCKECDSSSSANDVQLTQHLWDKSVEMINTVVGEKIIK